MTAAPVERHMSPYHTALRSVFLVAMHHGLQIRQDQLAQCDMSDPLGSILRLMAAASLKSKVLRGCVWDDLASLGKAYPVMAVQKNGNWVIVIQTLKAADGRAAAVVLDPTIEASGVAIVPREQFMQTWSGMLVLSRRIRTETEQEEPFGLRWFIPEIMRHKRYLRDVAVAAIMCNVLSFATPLLYNVIIDKVISHQSYHTLYVVLLVFFTATLFDGLFSYLRQYLMLLATNKIDARLASRTFQHLLGLPLQFFESQPAGVLTRHMQQTEKVRQFLTGRLFQTLLDAVSLPILVVLLVMYSAQLTALVVAFSLVIAIIIGIMIPIFRHHLNRLYAAEGERQAHLVEAIHGMRTIKSLCVEPLQKKSWDAKVVNAVRRHASVGRMGILTNVITNGIDKVMQISVLGLGAVQVFNGNMSMGALVAFTMLSGRMSGPLLQMVALINEYQETALSIRMLGTVMDHPPERAENFRGTRPEITGDLEFDRVTFRYFGTVTPALDRVSFKVEEGQVIGVVGRSGSGKTTVTKLIQGIHAAQEGLIRLNGIDIRHIDLQHLRKSVGVVLQENFLFRGTVRDNISATKPDAPLAEIVEAARLAGAEEFIDRMPMSYDTRVEESATNLSGGQRQRIAIARALLLKPKLLIFDEATSALDPDSEAIVQQNLTAIARGRTLIIVSHRLSSLVWADSILVLEQGKVADFAPHHILVERCNVYSHLWQTQIQHIQHRPRSTALASA